MSPSPAIGRGRPVDIIGAGPAGLAAAITLARAGVQVVVHEREDRVGSRFHGDFQGLENWSTRRDTLDELAGIGIEIGCELQPFREQTCFDAGGHKHVIRSREPLYYLLRRGTGAGTLDDALVAQAARVGVEIRFGEQVDHLPEGGIVAGGPRAADAIAVGYLFDTARADGAIVAFGHDLAPGGYAYLLIHGGRGTLATCLFKDFHREKDYLARTVAFFRDRVGLDMQVPHPFSGFGNFELPSTATRGGLLVAGEAAGFQDTLWGFGLRYAMLSGHLAARAILAGQPTSYDGLWRTRLAGQIRAAMVNRFIFERLGDRGYGWLLAGASRAADARTWLRHRYAPSLAKSCLWPVARAAMHSRIRHRECAEAGCDCTWCRCQHAKSGREAA